MLWYSWGSPVALGIFLIGLGVFFRGLSAGETKTPKKN